MLNGLSRGKHNYSSVSVTSEIKLIKESIMESVKSQRKTKKLITHMASSCQVISLSKHPQRKKVDHQINNKRHYFHSTPPNETKFA